MSKVEEKFALSDFNITPTNDKVNHLDKWESKKQEKTIKM